MKVHSFIALFCLRPHHLLNPVAIDNYTQTPDDRTIGGVFLVVSALSEFCLELSDAKRFIQALVSTFISHVLERLNKHSRSLVKIICRKETTRWMVVCENARKVCLAKPHWYSQLNFSSQERPLLWTWYQILVTFPGVPWVVSHFCVDDAYTIQE